MDSLCGRALDTTIIASGLGLEAFCLDVLSLLEVWHIMVFLCSVPTWLHKKRVQERINEAMAKATQKGSRWKPGTEKPKRVTLDSGKHCVVDGNGDGNGDVFLIANSHGSFRVEIPQNLEDIKEPELKDTALFRITNWAVSFFR